MRAPVVAPALLFFAAGSVAFQSATIRSYEASACTTIARP